MGLIARQYTFLWYLAAPASAAAEAQDENALECWGHRCLHLLVLGVHVRELMQQIHCGRDFLVQPHLVCGFDCVLKLLYSCLFAFLIYEGELALYNGSLDGNVRGADSRERA